jgi:cytochrome P450
LIFVPQYPFIRAIYNISPLHPLWSYPGPLLWRASRIPWILSLQSGNLHLDIKSFHDQYGPVIRIAPNEISYTDARALKDIYAPTARPAAIESEPQGVLERNPTWFGKKSIPSEPWSIMGINEAAHARYRRAFMGAFSDKALRDYSDVLESYVDLFIRKLHEKASASEPVDLVNWFNFVTFDISGVLSFGESFGNTEAGQAHPWVAITCAFGKGIALLASLNFLGLTTGSFAPLVKRAIPTAVRERMAYHRQITEEKVGRYLDSGHDPKDNAAFIDAALHFNETTKNNSDVLTKPELNVNMAILIFAGSETTSSALSAILSYLLQNKPCLSSLTKEIRNTFPTPQAITVATVSKLDYLTAVISETLRIAPPVVIGVPRVVPPGGAKICDKLVPEGTYVVLNQYPTYRSPANFSDPDTFDPSRFLNSPPNDKDNLNVFQPFSIGRHQCIGQRLAWAELRLITARLLYTFDIEFADTRWQGKDFVKQKTFIFWEKEPLMVRLKARK